MGASTLRVDVGEVTYLVDDPKAGDGLKATVSVITQDMGEGGPVPRTRYCDRINLDRMRDREKFAEKAETKPDDLLEVRDRILDHLAPPPNPEGASPAPVDPEVEATALALLDAPDLLDRVGQLIGALGYAGDLTQPTLLYLALTSRLTARPMNVLIGGPSSAGKSFLMDTVADCFPVEATYRVGAMSERALVYTDADFQHRHVLISEAAAIHRDGPGALIVRSLIWGNSLDYEVTEQDAAGVMRTRRISKPGPTGLITTSVKGIEPELETRILTLSVADDEQATRDILLARGERAEGRQTEQPDLRPWRAAQRWLAEEGEHEVVIPYGTSLASRLSAKLVRIRRDIDQLLTLIGASAILHQRQRARDAQNRIIATEADYWLIYDLAEPVFGAAAAEGVTPAVRETVEVVGNLTRHGERATVSHTLLAAALGLDKSAVSRRVQPALRGGYLVNDETARGKPSKLHLGDPLPEARPALPAPETLFDTPPSNAAPLQHSDPNPHNGEETGWCTDDDVLVHQGNGLAPTGDGGAGVLHPGVQLSDPHHDVENGLAAVGWCSVAAETPEAHRSDIGEEGIL